MDKYFDRQIQLWGNDTQELLKTKKIVIIGCGGLGCSLGIALGSSGIGQIDLVDFDTVGIHNIHRQIGFTVNDENKNKSKVLKNLLQNRCPYVKINNFDCNFETFSRNLKYDCYDLILDATDNLNVRVKIDKFSKDHNIPWIYGSVEAFHGQVCFFKKASFSSVFNIIEHNPEGIAAPIVMNIASLQANFAIRYLTNISIKKDYLYYCFFNEDGEFIIQKFGLP
jgi:molybdopterin/thiamine biosynthesis adenylyltransferase